MALDDRRARRTAHPPDRGSEPGMVAGRIDDRVPLRPDHARPSPAVRPGGERFRRGAPVANLRGSAESVSWSGDGRALLVLAADPGSYALDWSARFVTGADGVAPPIRRPADAWRRLFRVDVTTGEADEVGPAGLSVWEVAWDGGSTVVALVSEDPSGNGWYHGHLAMLDLERRSARSIVEPRRMLEGAAVAGWDPRRRGRRLFERSRPARRQRPRDRARERPHRRPVARPPDGRPGVMGR